MRILSFFSVCVLVLTGCDNLFAPFLKTQSGSFVPTGRPCAGQNPKWVAIGDINKDSHPDLAVIAHDSREARILMGDGRGRFTEGQRISFAETATCCHPWAGALADLNRDGALDLVVSTITDENTGNQEGFVRVVWGLPAGGLGPAPDPSLRLPAGGQPSALSVGDLNGDGWLDVAVADSLTFPTAKKKGYVVIYGGNQLGDSRTDATSDMSWNQSSSAKFVVIEKTQATSLPKLYIVNDNYDEFSEQSNTFVVNFQGVRQHESIIQTRRLPIGMAVSDFDKNGTMDIAIAKYRSDTAPAGYIDIIIRNPDGGTYKMPTLIELPGTSPHAIGAGDFNGDGKPDLVASDSSSNNHLILLLGDGGGGFMASKLVGVGAAAQHLAIADLNHDGKDDVVLTAALVSRITVLLGTGVGGSANGIDLTAIDSTEPTCTP